MGKQAKLKRLRKKMYSDADYSKVDQQFFLDHPTRHSYTRAPFPVEYQEMPIPENHKLVKVKVTQIADGVRLRHPVIRPL